MDKSLLNSASNTTKWKQRDEVDQSNIISDRRSRVQSVKVRENADTFKRPRAGTQTSMDPNANAESTDMTDDIGPTANMNTNVHADDAGSALMEKDHDGTPGHVSDSEYISQSSLECSEDEDEVRLLII